jgi:hypothetical protein
MPVNETVRVQEKVDGKYAKYGTNGRDGMGILTCNKWRTGGIMGVPIREESP